MLGVFENTKPYQSSYDKLRLMILKLLMASPSFLLERVFECVIFVADKPAESGVADQHPLKNFQLKILELPQELYPSV